MFTKRIHCRNQWSNNIFVIFVVFEISLWYYGFDVFLAQGWIMLNRNIFEIYTFLAWNIKRKKPLFRSHFFKLLLFHYYFHILRKNLHKHPQSVSILYAQEPRWLTSWIETHRKMTITDIILQNMAWNFQLFVSLTLLKTSPSIKSLKRWILIMYLITKIKVFV